MFMPRVSGLGFIAMKAYVSTKWNKKIKSNKIKYHKKSKTTNHCKEHKRHESANLTVKPVAFSSEGYESLEIWNFTFCFVVGLCGSTKQNV